MLKYSANIYVKKNFLDFIHLFYDEYNYFHHEFIRNFREDGVQTWPELTEWEGGVSYERLGPRIEILQERCDDEEFDHLRRSSFTSFFSSNFIDIPRCFKGIKSLYRTSHTLPIIRFTNLVMRRGFKEKTSKALSRSALRYTNLYWRKFFLANSPNTKWQNTFLTLAAFRIGLSEHNTYFNAQSSQFGTYLNSLNLLQLNESRDSSVLHFSNLFFQRLVDLTPAFHLYIYKVNKSKRKNSRGKSGKYTLIWKYIAPFKRLYLTFRWLIKDLKLQKADTFEERCYKLWQLVGENLENSQVYKAKKFSHKYVFRNYRQTLMSSFKACT